MDRAAALAQIKNSRTGKLFDFIVRHKTEHDGASPTVRECMAELGTGSSSLIVYYLDRLERLGLIRYHGVKARAIEVVGGRWSLK